MEQISLGQIYDIYSHIVDEESLCYLCLISVSPISGQYRLGNAVMKRIELNNYDLMSIYRDIDVGREKVLMYLNEPLSNGSSGFVKHKLQQLQTAYDDYEQVPWRNFRLKMHKRQNIINMRNYNVPAQYVFDLAYNYFAQKYKMPVNAFKEKMLNFIK